MMMILHEKFIYMKVIKDIYIITKVNRNNNENNKNREKCIKTLWVVIIHRFLVCDMPINVILRYKMNGNPAKTQREKPHKICHAKRLKNTST